MPLHENFAKIRANMLNEYGEKGEQVYHAWINKCGYDDTKPIEGQKCKAEEIAVVVVEKFEWTMPLRFYQVGDGLIIRGEAIHSGVTRNKNLYKPEELLRSARSLIGTRLQHLDHTNWLDEGNEVLDAEFVEPNKIEYVARVLDPKAVEAIKKGEITHVSIDAICRKGTMLDGGIRACEGMILNGLCLVHREDPAGDIRSSVSVWEKVAKSPPPNPDLSGKETVNNLSVEVLEKKFGELEATVKSVQQWIQTREQEDERERQREAQRERAQKYGISPKEGGNLTKPSEYEGLSDDQFADPVNYRYPIDKEHAQPALTYFNQADNRQAGGYTHEEAVKIMTKIINAALSTGAVAEVSYQPEDPVYKDLPEELKSKLAGYKAQETAPPPPPSGVGVTKPIGAQQLQPELGVIKVEEIEAIIMDRKLFTPALKVRGILDLIEGKRKDAK